MHQLNSGFTYKIATFVKPEYLYLAALFFLVLTFTLVAATYHILYSKKKKHNFRTNIRQRLEEWITEVITSESDVNFDIPAELLVVFEKQEARQMLIEELVRNKTNFLGSVSENIIKLYYQLGLNVDSKIKLDVKRTHIQCQGIHELCVMEQKDQLLKVYRLTNSDDKDVRIEAQTAILQWYGFKGLRFLDVVSYPITEFQQLKLLELLRQLPFTGFTRLNNWLSSSNDTVVNFSLKLAEHYLQAQVKDEVEQCLLHKNPAIHVQAAKTLAVLVKQNTPVLPALSLQTEKFTNWLSVLKHQSKFSEMKREMHQLSITLRQ
jgi:hypothetical protein